MIKPINRVRLINIHDPSNICFVLLQIDTNIVQTLQKYLTDIIQIAEIVWKYCALYCTNICRQLSYI